MAQFYASIGGSAKEVTRQGTERSGVHGHIRGWDSGVKVLGHVNKDGEDEFHIYVTGGSHGYESDHLIAVVKSGQVKVTI